MGITNRMLGAAAGYGAPSPVLLVDFTKASNLVTPRDTIEFTVVPKQSLTITEVDLLVETTGDFDFYQDGVFVETVAAAADHVIVEDILITEASTLSFVRQAGGFSYPYATTNASTTSTWLTTLGDLPAQYWPVVALTGYFNGTELSSPTWVGDLSGTNIASGFRSAYGTNVTISEGVRLIAVRTANLQDAASVTDFHLEIDAVQVGPAIHGYGDFCVTPLYEADQMLSSGTYAFSIVKSAARRDKFWSGQSAGWTDAPFTTGSWTQATAHGVWHGVWMEFLYV